MRITTLAVLAGAVALVACGSRDAPTSAVATPSPTVQIPSPSPSPTPSPSPSPSPTPAPQPSTRTVYFAGLPNGTYPVHLHSACNGSQQFHITVLPSLAVRGGAGTISVSSGYFGRGLCLIVYASPSLTSVLATKRI